MFAIGAWDVWNVAGTEADTAEAPLPHTTGNGASKYAEGRPPRWRPTS